MVPPSPMLRAATAALPLLAAACAADPFDAKATLDGDIRTVIEVSWEPIGTGEAWVEFGPTDAYGSTTPPVPDGEGRSRALLLGNKPFQQVHWRVVSDDGSRRLTGPDRILETEGIPAPLPDYHLDESDGSFDGFVLGISWAEVAYATILDADAEVVWYAALPVATVSLSVDPVPGQAAIRYLQVGMDHALDQSVVITRGLDGLENGRVEVEQGHHCFVAHDDGALSWLAIDVQEHKDWGDLVGDRVMHRSAAGGITQLYSTWDHLEYDPETTLDSNFYPQGTDWTHTNTISWAPDRGSYWLTMGGVNDLVEIDATTGEPLTVVGTDGYALDPEPDGFGSGFGPHAASWTADGTLLVFDNNNETSSGASRVLELALDDDAGVAREVWRYEGEPGMMALVLGGADRLDSGETFIQWGNTGIMSLVGPDGAVRWAARQESIVADATVLWDLYGRQ
jgi:hypothetical protein